MNIILFESDETVVVLHRDDARARHLRSTMRCAAGDTFDVGRINGPRGKATVTGIDNGAFSLVITWGQPHSPPPPTRLVVGLPRPQTSRDILREATTLGVTKLDFVLTARSDANYRQSSLWQGEEWRRQIITGAAQAFDTHLPAVAWTGSLREACQHPAAPTHHSLALDIYEAETHLSHWSAPSALSPVTIFIGPERGWDERDRATLREFEIPFYSVGERVLRTETAVVAALTLIQAARVRAQA